MERLTASPTPSVVRGALKESFFGALPTVTLHCALGPFSMEAVMTALPVFLP